MLLSVDANQTPCSAASGLVLDCIPRHACRVLGVNMKHPNASTESSLVHLNMNGYTSKRDNSDMRVFASILKVGLLEKGTTVSLV